MTEVYDYIVANIPVALISIMLVPIALIAIWKVLAKIFNGLIQ